MNSFQRACSGPCALEVHRADREKQAAKARAEARREKAEGRKRLMTLTQACAKVQPDVNRYVRARDAKYGVCICGCGRGIDDAGHFFPIGSKYRASRLRFEVDAIHGCCAKCNRFIGGGNVAAFEAGLRARYGDDYVDGLHEMKRRYDHGTEPALTKDEVWQIGVTYRAKTRELKSGGKNL